MIFGFFKRKPKEAVKEAKPEETGQLIGAVTHYFPHSKAAVLKLETALNIGDTIRIKGHTTDFKQKIASMQINGKPIENAQKGEEIGLLVKDKVRHNDAVYKIG